MKRIGWLCGAVAAVVVCAAIVRAQGGAGNSSGNSSGDGSTTGKGGMREDLKGFFEQQKEENVAFRSQLEGVTNLDQKLSEIIQHRDQQYQEDKTALANKHTEIMAKIADKMAKNSRLTDAEKKDVTDFFNNQYQENVTFWDGVHTDVITFLKGLESAQGTAKDGLKEKIQTFMQQEKEKAKQHMEDQQAARKAFREKIGGEMKANKGTASGSGSGTGSGTGSSTSTQK